MKPHLRRFNVPIYNVQVFVLVADKPIAASRILDKSLRDILSGDDGDDTGAAFCLASPSARKCALVFDRTYLDLGAIAHEVFHLTHRILEFADTQIEPQHHEPGAYLCEFLTKEVIRAVRRFL